MEKEIELLPHNEIAYNKLLLYLEKYQMVSIDHATGTGKSFINAKYLYKNKHKRILYLSSNYTILDQFVEEQLPELNIEKDEFANLDTMIYKTLLNKNMEELATKYDIIILDEYHRCGANKSGAQVERLLKHLREKHPNVKVIGTTATEIRYLDNMKNMNKILFNGVCASKLTLVDAILQGILPIPVYIISLTNLIDEIDKIEEKIKRYAFYEEEFNYYLPLLEKARRNVETIIRENINIESNFNIETVLKDSKKIIVFSSNIFNIPKDQTIINNLLKNRTVNEYTVHSNFSKHINKTTIRRFRKNYNKDSCDVLYNVNILTEGVHINDVDTLIMLRKTKSPIVYFQELGRLLSYGKRKDKVVVLDLVSNIKNNPFIYEVYIELITKAHELLEKDPTNKKRYLDIIERLKIIGDIGRITKEIESLKEKTKISQLIDFRLQTVISILEGKTYATDIEKVQANIDIFKFKKYIDIDKFDIINKLSIEKPNIFDLTRDEFLGYLDGSKNIYDKEFGVAKRSFKNAKEFYSINNRLPSILTADKNELFQATMLLNNFSRLTNKEQRYISNVVSSKDSLFEQIVYKKKKNFNINDLYEELDKIFSIKVIIPLDIVKILEKQNTNISNVYLRRVNEHNIKYNSEKLLIKKSDLIKRPPAKETIFGVDTEILFRKDFKEMTSKISSEISKTSDTTKYVETFCNEICDFIKTNHRLPKYFSSNNSNVDEKERELFCKKVILSNELEKLGYTDIINDLYEEDKKQLFKIRKKCILKRIFAFADLHDGDFPSSKINSPEEQALAKEFSNIKKYLTDEDLNDYFDKYGNRHQQFISNYIDFIKKNKRYPILDSSNEKESNLVLGYIRNEPFITPDDKALINDAYNFINKRQAMKNAYQQFKKIKGK